MSRSAHAKITDKTSWLMAIGCSDAWEVTIDESTEGMTNMRQRSKAQIFT